MADQTEKLPRTCVGLTGLTCDHLTPSCGGVISHFVRLDALCELLERMGEQPATAAEEPPTGVV